MSSASHQISWFVCTSLIALLRNSRALSRLEKCCIHPRLAHRLQFTNAGKPMLRISVIKSSGETVTLHLDGQVTGRWAKLLKRMCEVRLKKDVRVTIDLRNVSFADRDGIALLRNLTVRQVKILNALPFIAEQISKATEQ